MIQRNKKTSVMMMIMIQRPKKTSIVMQNRLLKLRVHFYMYSVKMS